MKAKKTYTIPKTKSVMLNTHDGVMQDTFSGGDAKGTGISIDKEADSSDGDSRSNLWTNHLWDEDEL